MSNDSISGPSILAPPLGEACRTGVCILRFLVLPAQQARGGQCSQRLDHNSPSVRIRTASRSASANSTPASASPLRTATAAHQIGGPRTKSYVPSASTSAPALMRSLANAVAPTTPASTAAAAHHSGAVSSRATPCTPRAFGSAPSATIVRARSTAPGTPLRDATQTSHSGGPSVAHSLPSAARHVSQRAAAVVSVPRSRESGGPEQVLRPLPRQHGERRHTKTGTTPHPRTSQSTIGKVVERGNVNGEGRGARRRALAVRGCEASRVR